MSIEIKPTTTPFVLNVSVNCYLVNTGDGFILIDTDRFSKRYVIETELDKAECKPGNLRLILLTHGDFDHCGNAAYLRRKFSPLITLHEADAGIVERGDMFWNRKQPNWLMRTLVGLFFRLHKLDRFTRTP